MNLENSETQVELLHKDFEHLHQTIDNTGDRERNMKIIGERLRLHYRDFEIVTMLEDMELLFGEIGRLEENNLKLKSFFRQKMNLEKKYESVLKVKEFLETGLELTESDGEGE